MRQRATGPDAVGEVALTPRPTWSGGEGGGVRAQTVPASLQEAHVASSATRTRSASAAAWEDPTYDALYVDEMTGYEVAKEAGQPAMLKAAAQARAAAAMAQRRRRRPRRSERACGERGGAGRRRAHTAPCLKARSLASALPRGRPASFSSANRRDHPGPSEEAASRRQEL